jgi:hypothetical protein
MTEEERAEWQRRCNAAPKPSPEAQLDRLETRLDWLESDSAAQRTAILKLERQVWRLQGAFWGSVAGIVFGAIGWGVLT